MEVVFIEDVLGEAAVEVLRRRRLWHRPRHRAVVVEIREVVGVVHVGSVEGGRVWTGIGGVVRGCQDDCRATWLVVEGG